MNWQVSLTRTRIFIAVAITTLSGCLVLTAVDDCGASQEKKWDLANDWRLFGKDLAGIPFGPDSVWGVYSVQFSPKWSWRPFNRAMHFTSSNSWLGFHNIDGWWLGETPEFKKPLMGKNMGHGNILRKIEKVGPYDWMDWPVGRLACHTWPDPQGKSTMSAAVWIAPEEMVVQVDGGVWTVGRSVGVQGIEQRRSAVRMWIDRAANDIGPADEILFADILVPLWTDNYDASRPKTFAEILGPNESRLRQLRVAKGDRICVGFYWHDEATVPGVSGIDFKVLQVGEDAGK